MAALSDKVRAFLEQPHFAVVATLAEDGTPHQTVIWYAVDGDDLIFSVPEGSIKHRNLERDPRVSLCIEDGFRYVTVVGTTALETDPARAREGYGHIGARYRAAMTTPMPQRPPSGRTAELLTRERVGVRVSVERVISQGVE